MDTEFPGVGGSRACITRHRWHPQLLSWSQTQPSREPEHPKNKEKNKNKSKNKNKNIAFRYILAALLWTSSTSWSLQFLYWDINTKKMLNFQTVNCFYFHLPHQQQQSSLVFLEDRVFCCLCYFFWPWSVGHPGLLTWEPFVGWVFAMTWIWHCQVLSLAIHHYKFNPTLPDLQSDHSLHVVFQRFMVIYWTITKLVRSLILWLSDSEGHFKVSSQYFRSSNLQTPFS